VNNGNMIWVNHSLLMITGTAPYEGRKVMTFNLAGGMCIVRLGVLQRFLSLELEAVELGTIKTSEAWK
jgi:hypothetical protein